MAIYNLRYIQEAYKSKYAGYFDKDYDDDEEEDDDDDEKEKKSSEPRNPSKHVSNSNLKRISLIAKATLSEFPKLKRCCDFINIDDKDDYDDDGKKASAYDFYMQKKPTSYIQLLDGDIFSGYPNKDDSDDYEEDKKAFIKRVNEKLENEKINAKFTSSGGDEDSVSFGVKAL